MSAAIRLAVVVLALAAPGVAGQTVDVGAEASAQTRLFPASPLFATQEGARVSPSLVLAPEIEVESEDGRWRLEGEGFLRIDAHDGGRTHADVRELGVSYLGRRFSAFAGAGQVFWGVTEVRHLVDVVNQVDAVEDVDGEDKLGQPMLAFTLERDWGVVDAYLLPYFRARTFPGGDARLRGPLPVGEDAVLTSGGGRWDFTSFAIRGFRTLGALDLGLSFFHGTSREPRLAVRPEVDGVPALVPLYDPVDQVGLDVQWTGASTLLKLEAMTRTGHTERIYALTGGVERTLYQFLRSDGDLGVLAEIMLDSRDEGAPQTLFEHDLFVGGRWAWNDAADTSVLGGPLVDLSSGETLLLLELGRRIGLDWSVAADARFFAHTDDGSPMHGMRRDGFVSVALTRFF